MTFGMIQAWCDTVAHANHEWGVTNPFSLYERLLDVLAGGPFDVRPLQCLMEPTSADRVTVSLRHDLDANLLPAFKAAKALSDRKITGSFYPLHTSPYWSEVRDGVFLRQPGLNDVIDQFTVTKQEVGLHIDPLHIYFAHGVDGTHAVLEELAWLRSRTISVAGVVAHNSAPVYGAENFEMIKGLSLDGRPSIEWNGVTAPLQTIDLEEQGLTYEGNYSEQPDQSDRAGLDGYLANVPPDALRRVDWQAIYLLHNPVFSRRNDSSVWLVGRDLWTIAVHKPIKRLLANVDTQTVFDWLRNLDAPQRVVIVIHPEYIGGGA